MDTFYLQELIEETNARGGGLVLNFQDKPAIVVLSVDKYNKLMSDRGLLMPEQQSAGTLPIIRQDESKKVLVTGGAGYIGAHLVRELLKARYEVLVLDNLSTGKRENVPNEATFIEGDIADVSLLRDLFASSDIDCVFHMAASIEVLESVEDPQKYFENNVSNTCKLLAAMYEAGVKKIIFSSTAAIYGEQEIMPIAETAAPKPNNPYGATKLLGEKIIGYYCKYSGFTGIVFRYFNACGCGFDGSIRPTHYSHLIPIVLEVAGGKRPQILINGNDYQTSDGTCVRDYVHVLDIAAAHVLALENMSGPVKENFRVFNIGTGKGFSVKEIINAAAETLNRIIPMEIGSRRAGDAPATVADNTKIVKELGFAPKYSDLETIISSSWTQANKN